MLVTYKPRVVTAYRVTWQSAVSVALWCGGTLEACTRFSNCDGHHGKANPSRYYSKTNSESHVFIDVAPDSQGIGGTATLHDFVIRDGDTWLVLKPDEFEDTFDVLVADGWPDAAAAHAAKPEPTP